MIAANEGTLIIAASHTGSSRDDGSQRDGGGLHRGHSFADQLPTWAASNRGPNHKQTAGVNTMTVTPTSGTTRGGIHVKISGGPWDEDTVSFTTVMFGESAATDVEGADKADKNDQYEYTSIKAVSPPHDAGVVDITVITPDGSEKKGAFTYTFVVTSVNPSGGRVADAKEGKIAVIIRGEDFTDVEEVKFGEEAARFAVISQSEILAVVPSAKKAGTVVVTVKTPHGQNTREPTFEYTT